MKTNKIPTTAALLTFSWIIAVSTVLISGYLIILRFSQANSLILGLSILLGGLLLACLVRMFGVIGQMLFEFTAFVLNNFDKIVSGQAKQTRELLKQSFLSLKQDLKTQLEQINCGSKDINQELTGQAKQTRELLQDLKTQLEQINCDSKDINQNIHQLSAFFEQIEKHLKLKK